MVEEQRYVCIYVCVCVSVCMYVCMRVCVCMYDSTIRKIVFFLIFCICAYVWLVCNNEYAYVNIIIHHTHTHTHTHTHRI